MLSGSFWILWNGIERLSDTWQKGSSLASSELMAMKVNIWRRPLDFLITPNLNSKSLLCSQQKMHPPTFLPTLLLMGASMAISNLDPTTSDIAACTGCYKSGICAAYGALVCGYSILEPTLHAIVSLQGSLLLKKETLTMCSSTFVIPPGCFASTMFATRARTLTEFRTVLEEDSVASGDDHERWRLGRRDRKGKPYFGRGQDICIGVELNLDKLLTACVYFSRE